MTEGKRRPHAGADRAAIGVSFLCLVHCLLLPVAITLLPAAAGWLKVPESFHLLAVAVAVPISAIAIVSGYRRHGIIIPGIVALVGLAMIALGAGAGFGEIVETIVTVAGSLILAAGHLFNWRARSGAALASPGTGGVGIVEDQSQGLTSEPSK